MLRPLIQNHKPATQYIAIFIYCLRLTVTVLAHNVRRHHNQKFIIVLVLVMNGSGVASDGNPLKNG